MYHDVLACTYIFQELCLFQREPQDRKVMKIKSSTSILTMVFERKQEPGNCCLLGVVLIKKQGIKQVIHQGLSVTVVTILYMPKINH